MWLRVIISPQNIRKVQLSQLPDSVDSLKAKLKSKLEIQEDFLLQYEDPDFGNELCNLTDISELPAERAVLKIVWDPDSSVLKQSDTQSVSSLDTASVSTSSSQSSSAVVQSHMRSTLEWPSPFPIPTFSYDVELRLRRANEAYEQTNKALSVPREMKSHILEKIAEAVFVLKAYPHTEEIETVASALVLKHPCLTEPGKGKGFDGWKMSIKFKLGNYRSKLRSAGCHEVNINRKRGGGDGDDKKIPLKKAKRGEVNYLPDHPGGQSDDTLEEERLILVEELKKRTKDAILISQKMSLTFSLRRKEIVEGVPMVSEVLERWPALSLPNEIGNEFKRITNVDLLDTFKSSLHQHAPQLLKLYRARQGAFGKEMEDLLNKLDQQTSNIVNHRKQGVLEGLPLFLREDPSALFRKYLDTSPADRQTRGMKMGILVMTEDDVAPSTLPTFTSFSVVLEEAVVLKDISDLQSAVAYLFGLIFALDFQYPKELKYTFEVIEKVFMEMGTQCSARVQSLKTKLFL
ncbi:sterile alpha motif domain-containing protein 3-like [Paramormyrops kingsleyae]|uniref:sterile alpha motif domain-containing protein 3-like n=1 Tax=Paramormyrops kingsleyae TaxID=1676925 RepID=UPI003B96C6DE